MNVKKTTFMSFFSTFVQIVLKTNKNVSILWCVSKLWTKEKLWKRREVYHESKKGITFVLILTLIIVILVDTKVHIRNIIFQRHHIVRLSSYLKNGEQLQLTVRR